MGPHGYNDGARAAALAVDRQLDLKVRDGWHIRYDGAADQFVAAKDIVAAHSLDELLIEMRRADAGTIGDADEVPL